jgi:tripartite motif-containing protein 71
VSSSLTSCARVDSPEILRFDLDLPQGAELRANDGVTEVYEGEKLTALISPPHAVDAQGTSVPVTMDVQGGSIVLHVAHREGDYAYPILVDPEYTQNDWVNNAWIFYNRYDVLEDNTFLPNWNDSRIKVDRWCIASCWGSGRGLFISFPSNTEFGLNRWAQWTYTPPGETSYLSGYLINPLYRYDYTNCVKYSEPHDYDGLWDPTYGIYRQLYTNRAVAASNASIYGNTAQTGKVMVFGMSSGNHSNIPCWRDLYAGGIATYMTDPDNPTLDPISGYPTGWFDNSRTYSVNVSAHDHGLGVANVFLLPNGKPQVTLNPTNCYGTHDSPCYRDLAAPIYFNGNNFSEGKSEAKVVANDALLRASNTYSWTAYVDNTPPEVTLSSQLAEATNEEGPVQKEQKPANPKPGEDKLRLPFYNLKIEAEDGKKGSEATMRSGVKNIEIFLDKKTEPEVVPWKAQSCSGPEYSCPMTVNYPLSLTGLPGGTHILKVVASDQLGHPRTREIEFKYIPATGMKDEYVMQHFPLPSGNGNEEEWPELAVNVMNGNLAYSEKDVDVPGYAADLEVERFYNSQLPKADSTEWGEGWTLAQTPQLEAEAGATPKEAELLDESGGLNAGVQLPSEAGTSKFSPVLQAKVTKESGGSYALTDESGKSETTVAFNSSGDTEEERTGPYSSVDYNYAAGKLDEIAVKDPASAPDLSAAEEEAYEYVPPAPSFQSAFGALGSGDGQLKAPGDISLAANGDLFVVDRGNNRIERFNQEGKFVSKFGSEGTGNGQFKRPCSIAIDASGNLYVADAGNNRIEKFNEKGEFLKAAGAAGTGNAQFKEPEGLSVDAKGNVLVADSYNQRIQKLNSALEFVSKFGSSGTGSGQFNQVNSIDVGPGGKIWVVDWGLNRVTQFNEAGEFAQQFGSAGTGNGQFSHPDAIEVDSRGDVFVADQSNNRVQQFNQAGKYQTKFGTGGSGNGQFAFTWPIGIAVDNKGGLWVTDVNNNRIQKWSVPNYRPSWFGAFGTLGTGDGQLKTPADVALADNGDLFVLDKGNSRVERFNREGKFVSKFGTAGSGNGQFNVPTSIAIDSSNHLWLADGANNRIEEFSESGEFIKAIGSKGTGNAQFYVPEGIATDYNGNVYVADTYNQRVQVFNEEGEFLSKFGSAGSGPGQFTEANAIDIGRHGEIYVADWGANRIEKFNEKGEFLLQFGTYGTGDGQFNHPDAIEADNNGNVWVGDQSNGRIELFNDAGEYVTQFGKAGTGEGQFSFTYPMGIAADSSGGLWITDANNNRIQKWQIPNTEAAKVPEANDPTLDVNLSAGLVSSVEGKEAGTNTYTHTGALLTANKGPDGEAKYEYDASNRMTKVTLPNGTWVSIAYEPTYGRVSKVTLDPAGAESAKSTFFSYVDYPSRTTTVTPEGAQAVIYTIGLNGDVVESRNVKKPPVYDNVGGSLANYWEKEVPPGEQTFDIQAHADEGISSVQYIVNGQNLVHETTCNENLETPEVECKTVKSEWVLETENFAPGTLYVEGIITDRLGETASKRFWVNIPQPPPPPPDGAPVKPKFSEVLSFREEFGLDVVDPPADEIARNERIFNLINAWTEGEPVARASRERWGVPLRPKDVAEMEYREHYVEVDGMLIEEWAESHYPNTYAGYYVDHPAGGVIRVGFTSNQESSVAELKAVPGILAPSRIAGFSQLPTYSRASLMSAEQTIVSKSELTESWAGVITSVGIEDASNKVAVGAPNVSQGETLITQALGSLSRVTVHYEAGELQEFAGRNRESGKMLAGDRIFSIAANRECTAGFGVYENRNKLGTNQVIQARLILTAGHCIPLNQYAERSKYAGKESEKVFSEVGQATRSGYQSGAWRTDAEAINLENDLAPNAIYRPGESPLRVSGEATARVGDVLCFSGMKTGKVRCKKVLSQYTATAAHFSQRVYVVAFGAEHGDSGAPVWNAGTGAAVGLIEGGPRGKAPLTYVTPLLNMPHESVAHAPGALAAPGMYDLHVITGE